MSLYTLFPEYIARDDGACIPLDPANSDYQAYLDWVAEGNVPDQQPPPTFTDYYTSFIAGFSAWMEVVARSNGYDSVLSCISYLSSGIPQYAQDAQSMSSWRDALWVWAAEWQAGFNGQLPSVIPTWEEVQAQAPQPSAYGWLMHATGQLSIPLPT